MDSSNGENPAFTFGLDPLGKLEKLSGIDLANDVMLLVDLERNKVLDAIPGSDTFCGWTREQLIHMKPENILPNTLFHQVEQSGNGWSSKRFETQIACNNGQKRELEVFTVRISEGGKQLLAFIVNDITRRKRHHAALERYFTVMDQTQKLAGIGFYEGNLATNEGFWSEGLYRLFGFAPGEVPPRQESFFKIVHPDDLPKIKAAIQKSLEEKQPSDIIHRIIRKDGETRILRAICTFVYDHQGRPTHHRGTFLDITESQHLLEKITESEEKFRTIVTHTEEILFQTDEKGIITFIAGRGLKRLGYTPEDLVGRSAEDFLQNRPDELHDVERALAGQTVRGEINFRNQRLRLWYSPLRNLSGKIVGLLGMAINVSEEYKVKKELEDKENYIRSVFCNIHEDIYVIDRKYKILDANRKFLISNGLERDQVLGRPCYSISHRNDHPCDLEGEDCYLKQVFETGEPVNYRHIHRDKDGHERFVDIIMSPIRDHSGKITEVIEATRDMTDLVLAERTRHIREVEFSAVINTAKDAVVGIDSEGNISIWNPAAEQMFGYSREEAIGTSMHSMVAPEKYQDDAINGLRQFFKNGTGEIIGQTVEITGLKKDGTEFPIELSISKMNLDGKWHAAAIIRDITERKRYQAKLKSALKKAKEGERVKTIFLANMSHEIRTPLNSILGFTESLKEKFKTVMDSESEWMFDIINQSGQRLLHTIHEILDMSQLETQSFVINPKRIDLEDCVRQTVVELEPRAEEKGLSLKLQGLSGTTTVTVDYYSFSQALSNIIENAIKYTNHGGVTIQLTKNDEYIVLSVTDTGIGMTPQYVKRLFNPFTQESEGHTKKFQGIGLGMSLAKKYLELNRIRLELNTKKNQGTRVRLFIPYYLEKPLVSA